MNQFFLMLGLETWKPLLTAVLLPPVPFLLLMLVAARLMFRRRILAWSLMLLGAIGIWGSCTMIVGEGLLRVLMPPMRALGPADLAQLKKAPGAPKTAIVVLGGGRDLYAPEYGMSNLTPISMERLRYALWLGRETGLPVAFSGGLSPGAPEGATEAEIAARIAAREFGRPLNWVEGQSRDTGENAGRTLALLAPEGIERIVLVTHDFHMARALRAFDRAREASGRPLVLVPAPMGLLARMPTGLLSWFPTFQGAYKTRLVLREALGRFAGA